MIKFNHDDIKYLAVELPDSIKYCKYIGDFFGEIGEIDKLLSRELPEALRMRLTIERVIAEGMKLDYKTNVDELLVKIKAKYPACEMNNLCDIVRMGQVDYIYKGGFSRMFFQKEAAANIFKCHKTILMRLTDPAAEPEKKMDRTENHEIMKKQGYRAFRFTVEESIAPKPSTERVGERIKIHLPYPAPCKSQPADEIKLLDSSHKVFISDAAQRTAYIENAHCEGEKYSIKFSYVNRAEYVEPDPAAVCAEQPDFFTGELYPHIRFTPLVCGLAKEIAGSEKNPLILARRVYDWVTNNVKYSFMREYLYLDNIVEFAIMNGRGDCGVMALTFITLCRRLGIPAKWESGSSVRPGDIGSHDWAQFYVAPYGWLYTDPSYGGGSLRDGDMTLWNHYFCNIDPFRLVANIDFQQPFDPPKAFMRTDPYDNQSGEAEYENYGLGFGELEKKRSVIEAEELK
jgi:hypothetical protein